MDPFRLILRETAPDGDLGDGGTGEPVASPAEAPPAPTGEATPPPGEDWRLSQDDWNTTVGVVGQLARYGPVLEQIAQAMSGASQPEPELPEFDPFNPDAVQAHINAGIQQGLQQALGPIMPSLQGVQAERRHAAYQSRLGELAPAQDEFPGASVYDSNRAELTANFLMEAAGMDEGNALAQATQMEREYVRKIGEAAVAAHMAKLQAQGEALREGSTNAPVIERDKIPTGPGWAAEVAKRIAPGVTTS